MENLRIEIPPPNNTSLFFGSPVRGPRTQHPPGGSPSPNSSYVGGGRIRRKSHKKAHKRTKKTRKSHKRRL